VRPDIASVVVCSFSGWNHQRHPADTPRTTPTAAALTSPTPPPARLLCRFADGLARAERGGSRRRTMLALLSTLVSAAPDLPREKNSLRFYACCAAAKLPS
jgi:hypothetical protein